MMSKIAQYTPATITLEMIEATLYASQGTEYRGLLKKWYNIIDDAYRPSSPKSHRSHLGCSVIGKECARSIWYGSRWVLDTKFSGRMNLLFNTGSLYEARFCALLDSIGIEVLQNDPETGRQWGVSSVNGHFMGSGDGVAIGVPDTPKGEKCLLEMKTHGENSFKKLKKVGVVEAKPEHHIQMQMYLELMGLKYGMYCAVNKNTDELHFEIIEHNTYLANHFLERAETIIWSDSAPKREFKADSTVCKYCDFSMLCHLGDTSSTDVNCRTCKWSYPSQHENEQSAWICGKYQCIIPKEKALDGCSKWEMRDLV
jgi:hypothetical protein